MSDKSSRRTKDLVLFLSLTVVILAQAVWWIIFMARLVDEKVELARQFGADPAFVEQLHDQEIGRQTMVGMEGIFFLVLVLFGAWLIYRSLIKAEELKFHQQNFLMAVTHELKTPLASMKIYLDSLTSPKIPVEKKTGIAPKMREDVLRLEKLVENILDAGKFERSGYALSKETFDLTRLLGELTNRMRQVPLTKEIEINEKLEPVQFFGDRKALSRAIEAIFENCLKYNESSKIAIDISLTNRGNKVIIAISDNGIGLKKGDRTKIFDRFYRVGDELKRSKPGTGLGLYLAREIIRQHDGEVTVASEGIGKGSRFEITLKRTDGNEENIAG
jgi:signal transduction histidine kinase